MPRRFRTDTCPPPPPQHDSLGVLGWLRAPKSRTGLKVYILGDVVLEQVAQMKHVCSDPPLNPTLQRSRGLAFPKLVAPAGACGKLRGMRCERFRV